MNRRAVLCRRAAILAGLAGVVAGCADRPPPAAHRELTIASLAFEPKVVTVQVGDSVTWINRDLVPHTITAKHADAALDAMRSGLIAPGDRFTTVVTSPGVQEYTCDYHPLMSGLLEVTDAAR